MTPKSAFPRRLGTFVIGHRWLVLVATVIAVAAISAGLPRLNYTTDSRVFFGATNPHRIAFEALEARFAEANEILIALAPEDGDAFSRRTLEAVEYVTEQAWLLPYASRVDSIANYQHSYADNDDLIIRDLIEDASGLDQQDRDLVRGIALSELALRDLLVSSAGDVTAVRVNLIFPGDAQHAAEQAAAAARRLADDVGERFPGIRAYLTGAVMISAAFAEATKRDLATLFPILLGVVAVMLALLLGSWAGMAAALAVAAFAALASLGIAGWFGVVLNPGSAAVPTVVLTLAVASSVHILTTFFDLRAAGRAKFRAVIESLEINLWPVFLTSATTAIGFLSLNASDAPPFRDLGNLVAAGVAVSFLCTITFLPAAMSLFPATPRQKRALDFRKIMVWLHGVVVARSRIILWLSLAVATFLVAGLARVELNDYWVEYFDESYAFRTDTDFVREHLTALNAIEYVIEAGEENAIYAPEYLRKVDEFVRWARSQPEVVSVQAITEILKRLNKNFHGDDGAFFRLPESADLAAQYLLVFEMSLPLGLDLNGRIDVAKSATRATVLTRGMSARDLKNFDARATAWLARYDDRGAAASGTGIALMFAHMSERNISSMIWGTLMALCLVSAILILALRSARVGLLSLVPNVLPAASAFGLWGYLVGEVGVAISVVAAITFGIVVDDTIHLLSKYQRGRIALGMDPETAIRYAFISVGKALFITTIVLIAGFLVLTASGFQPTWGMGWLASITIGIALLADFLLLPTLLLSLDRR